jgi:ubiquitin C-terminal hydrolase
MGTHGEALDISDFLSLLPPQFSGQQDVQEFAKFLFEKTSLEKQFRGEFTKILTCFQCGSFTVHKEDFLELCASSSGSSLETLHSLLTDFFKPGDVTVTCDYCQSAQPHKEQCTMSHVPNFLIVYIKNYKDGSTEVHIKNQVIQLAANRERLTLQLCGQARHHGNSIDEGHWTAEFHSSEGWYMANDAHVQQSDAPKLAGTWMLFRTGQCDVSESTIDTDAFDILPLLEDSR